MLYDDQRLRMAFGEHIKPGGAELTRQALELFPFPEGGRMADLGCGTGATLKLLIEQGFETVGLDISPILLAEAANHGPVVEGDFHCLPWPDHYLDGIFCECSLSLAKNPRQVLLECARVLKRGGGLVISDLLRKGKAGPGRTTEILNCAPGSMTTDELSTLLIMAGFSLRHQFNQDKALNELAARLVWNFGAADEMKKALGLDCGKGRDVNKFDYQLIIAEKDI